MKIAIPVDEKTMETTVCPSFGRSPFFLIYDTESKNAAFVDNSAAASQGGAGIKAAQAIVDNQVSALLTPRCGENAAQVIQAANIKIYKTAAFPFRKTLMLSWKASCPCWMKFIPAFMEAASNERLLC